MGGDPETDEDYTNAFQVKDVVLNNPSIIIINEAGQLIENAAVFLVNLFAIEVEFSN